MMYIYIIVVFMVIIIVLSYLFFRSVSYYAHLSVTKKSFQDLITVNDKEFLEIFKNTKIDWETNEKYKGSIFKHEIGNDSMIHVNAVFKINGQVYIFDSLKSYRNAIKQLKKEIQIIHTKNYLLNRVKRIET